MMSNVVEATILMGYFKGEDVLIPCIPVIPTDMPFQFNGLQFPISLAFAISIKKGQSLEWFSFDLDTDSFSNDNYMLRVLKSANLTISIYTQTMQKSPPTSTVKLNI